MGSPGFALSRQPLLAPHAPFCSGYHARQLNVFSVWSGRTTFNERALYLVCSVRDERDDKAINQREATDGRARAGGSNQSSSWLRALPACVQSS